MNSQKAAILKFIDSVYQEILEIENYWQMQVGGNDLRAPIEYFQDAVRAYIGDTSPERLSVPIISYDLKRLREYTDWVGTGAHVFDKKQVGSAVDKSASPKAQANALVKANKKSTGAELQRKKSDSRQLYSLYGTYTLLFAALLQEAVDINYREKVAEINQFVSDASELQEILKEILAEGEIDIAELKEVLEHTPNDDLKESILQYLVQMAERDKKDQKEEIVASIIKELEKLSKNRDMEMDAVEKAHFNFLAGQLMVYQNSQDLVKSMAAKGLNIAGRFVATESGRDMGKGSGKGRF